MRAMRVGIIDVGSNTVRLLVADRTRSGVEPVLQERDFLGLGEEVEATGRLSEAALRRTSDRAREQARIALELDCDSIEVIVTAPGRQAENGDELVAALASATGAPVRVLAPDEEGRLAFDGAISRLVETQGTVAVCDVGGGSTEVGVGTISGGVAWMRSFDLGSVRLTRRFVTDDPCGRKAVDRIRAEVVGALDAALPPLPQTALATGGTARAIGKAVGPALGPSELAAVVEDLIETPTRIYAKRHGIDPARVLSLAGGAVLLAEVQQLLETPLIVARGGLREGAVLDLFDRVEAAAA
jgi:exopolyphosphatase / guanosine-5'-triphosphate,3'-diphosphate pyrophosphatase